MFAEPRITDTGQHHPPYPGEPFNFHQCSPEVADNHLSTGVCSWVASSFLTPPSTDSRGLLYTIFGRRNISLSPPSSRSASQVGTTPARWQGIAVHGHLCASSHLTSHREVGPKLSLPAQDVSPNHLFLQKAFSTGHLPHNKLMRWNQLLIRHDAEENLGLFEPSGNAPRIFLFSRDISSLLAGFARNSRRPCVEKQLQPARYQQTRSLWIQ